MTLSEFLLWMARNQGRLSFWRNDEGGLDVTLETCGDVPIEIRGTIANFDRLIVPDGTVTEGVIAMVRELRIQGATNPNPNPNGSVARVLCVSLPNASSYSYSPS